MKGQQTTCLNCGTPFIKKVGHQKFCRTRGDRCRKEHHREKHNLPLVPDFIQYKKKSKIAGQDVRLRNTDREVMKLKNDRQYWEMVYSDAEKGIFPIATLGLGALGYSQGETGTEKAVLAILGGVVGNSIDKYMREEKTNSKANVQANALIQIKAIDRKIRELTTIAQITQKLTQKGVLNKVRTKSDPTRIYSANEILSINHRSLHFHPPFTVLGNPEKTFSMMIHGLPDAGKSHFSMRFAAYLNECHGSTAYFAHEEGTSKKLKEKVKRYDYKGDVVPGNKSFDHMKQTLSKKSYDFVFIDSINKIGLTANQLEELKTAYPNTAFIYILQSTKDGQYKGNREIEHNTEIKAKVVAGTVTITGKYGRGQFDVFAQIPTIRIQKERKRKIN